MPRYFFDITDGEQTVRDAEGVDLAGIEAARNEALSTLGEIARDELPDGDRRDFIIEIRDEAGRAAIRASLSLRVERMT